MGQRFHNARAGSVTVSGCGVDSPPGARGAAGQGGGAHQERALLAHGSRPCRRRVRRRLLGGVTAVDRQGVARQYGHDHDAPPRRPLSHQEERRAGRRPAGRSAARHHGLPEERDDGFALTTELSVARRPRPARPGPGEPRVPGPGVSAAIDGPPSRGRRRGYGEAPSAGVFLRTRPRCVQDQFQVAPAAPPPESEAVPQAGVAAVAVRVGFP